MAHVRVAAKNSLLFLSESIITRIIELYIFIWLSRFLSQDQFGQYNFIIAYLTLFAVFADFGMTSIIQREIARNTSLSSQLMGICLTFAGLFSIILIIISYSIFLLLHSQFGYTSETTRLILIATPFILFSAKIKSFRKIWEIMYVVNFKIMYIVLFNILGRLIFLASIWIIFTSNSSFYYLILAVGLCDLPGFICIALFYLKLFPRPRFSINITEFLNLLKKSFPILLSAVFYIIKLNVAVLIIEFYMTSDQVALFSVAWRIPAVFTVIPAILNITLAPVLAKKYIENRDVFMNVFGLSIKYLTILAIPIMIYFYVYMENIIVFLFKEQYIMAVIPAQILMFSLVFIFVSVFLNSTLIASDKQMYPLVLELISGSLFILLNILLIPAFGIIGASLAVVFSYISIIITGIFISDIRLLIITAFKNMIKPIVASSGILIVIFGMSFSYYITIIFGLLLFTLILLLLKGFDHNDRVVLAELIGEKQ